VVQAFGNWEADGGQRDLPGTVVELWKSLGFSWNMTDINEKLWKSSQRLDSN